jgi:hypothetical protein
VSMPPTPVPVDESISEDVNCISCGYNLRGLRRDGHCPECNAPITHSIRGDALRYADPAWLKKLQTGVKYILYSILFGILLGLAGVQAAAAGMAIQGLMLIATGVIEFLSLWGTWLLTTPEPRLASHEQPVTVRKLIRFCAVLGFCGALLSQAEGLATGLAAVILGVGGGVLGLVGVVELVGQLVYLRRFARRIPNPSLAKSTGVVLWGLPASTGVLVVATLAIVLVAGLSPGAGGMAFAAAGFTGVACILGLAVFVFSIWYIVLLFQYRGAFNTAEGHARINWDPAARQTWASGPDPASPPNVV